MSSSNNSLAAAQSKSTSTFLSALIVASVVAGIELIVFVILRSSIKKVYAPRTYLPLPAKRTPAAPWTPWGWVMPTLRAPSEGLIKTAGLDAYVYIRFLRMMVWFFGPVVLVTWPILLTLNSLHTNVGKEGLNSFTFGNIPRDAQNRYWAHLCCAYVTTFWAFYLIKREMAHYVAVRQAYLISSSHVALPQASTVLVTGVPKQYLTQDAFLRLTSRLPGGVKRLWITRELGDLPEMYDERLDVCNKLEAAETKLLVTAVKQHRSSPNNNNNNNNNPSADPNQQHQPDTLLLESNPTLSTRLVDPKKRPSHRLGFWGLWGKKVDTIDWAKDEIVRLTDKLGDERKKVEEHPPHNSVFIQFNEQLAAHIFAQAVIHHQPLRMGQRFVDVAPDDVISDNLNLNPYDERIRHVISWVLTIGLIILWSFPVTFVGIVSNVTALCTEVPWLSWLCKAPGVIEDVIQGILPPLLLMLLFVLLPIVLRLLGRYSGIPMVSEVELSLMKRYYLFLVIHGFLVTTLASGLTASLPAIAEDPSQAISTLAQNLPKASIFFMTYMTTTTLMGSAGALLQIADLVLYYLKLFVLASTPRSVFEIRYKMSAPQFGTLFPNTTLLATIGISYSIIAPVMSGLALLGFGVFTLAYKYLFLYVLDVPAAHETGGRFFPLAIQQVFVGLYISQICLAVLLFLARDIQNDASSIPQGALMIVLIAVTLFYNSLINTSYRPLVQYLPFSLEDKVQQEFGSGGAPLGEVKRDLKADQKKSGQEDYEMAPGEGGSAGKDRRQSKAVVEVEDADSGLNTWEQQRDPGKNSFLHPAMWEPTRPIWVPDDTLGLGKSEVADMRRRKIPASTAGAGMSVHGKVYVTRSPPENLKEAVEFSREQKTGIFALPGALGQGARRAAQKIGNETERLKPLRHHDSTARRNVKPPKSGGSRRRMFGGGLSGLAGTSESESEDQHVRESEDTQGFPRESTDTTYEYGGTRESEDTRGHTSGETRESGDGHGVAPGQSVRGVA